MHIYIHTHIYIYVHTYIHTFIHTYIHSFIHSFICKYHINGYVWKFYPSPARPDIIDYTTQLTGDAWSCANIFDEDFSMAGMIWTVDVRENTPNDG